MQSATASERDRGKGYLSPKVICVLNFPFQPFCGAARTLGTATRSPSVSERMCILQLVFFTDVNSIPSTEGAL